MSVELKCAVFYMKWHTQGIDDPSDVLRTVRAPFRTVDPGGIGRRRTPLRLGMLLYLAILLLPGLLVRVFLVLQSSSIPAMV